MSLLAMFRRKKQDVVETSSKETVTVAPVADETTDADSGTGTSETAEALTAPAENEAASAQGVDAAGAETAEAAAADVVEIPKQQSAEAAADNEAGEGARQ
ncbi:hypothetical protein ACFQ63_24125 [Streptomyces wedmorensis]|uniref:Gliding motility protein n=2 Tax=Streptomyces wedmorensis TaxID=43759 RepID=A0ABW6J1P3_STRWE